MVFLEQSTLTVSLDDLAKMIDHSLLHPTMTDDEIIAGLQIAKKYDVATACVKPYSISLAKDILQNSNVGICAVVGFPHGNSSTKVKVFEATQAVEEGADEIDVVVNIGKVLGENWQYVEEEIKEVNEAVTQKGAILKVIFENDYLQNKHIIKLCEICCRVSVAFVKTSTGYGFIKREDGNYNYSGATLDQVALMRKCSRPSVQVKAAGGVRTLDDLLQMRALSVKRIGATATEGILEEAKGRGIGQEKSDLVVDFPERFQLPKGY